MCIAKTTSFEKYCKQWKPSDNAGCILCLLRLHQGLKKRVEELLSDQGFGRKTVEGEGKNDEGGSVEREWRFAIKKVK